MAVKSPESIWALDKMAQPEWTMLLIRGAKGAWVTIFTV